MELTKVSDRRSLLSSGTSMPTAAFTRHTEEISKKRDAVHKPYAKAERSHCCHDAKREREPTATCKRSEIKFVAKRLAVDTMGESSQARETPALDSVTRRLVKTVTLSWRRHWNDHDVGERTGKRCKMSGNS
ncbi:hypothetical protein DPX39_030061400 [Trypanosoma brucei equiperdum]|uniref:Uncharacterized protein n=1 Tax=Trypanosoma brucei equiperdum TaxID=630700 RepID=A0A3L6LCU7_9TRYP|nr:hypothetical protein DPX39_030061400 [Trypanosoma brucei equiperdum]